MTETAIPTTPPVSQDDTHLIPAQSEQDVIHAINEGIKNNTLATDIRISRFAILQPLSPEIANQVPGFQAGMIVDNVTREVLTTYDKPPWMTTRGVNPAELQPVHYLPFVFNFKLPTEYIQWRKREERKPGEDRWEFKTLDPKDPRVKKGMWVSKGGTFTGRKPPVTDNSNFLVLPLDLEQKIPKGYFRVASFSRTSAPCGQTAAGHLTALGLQGLSPWDKVYYLYTKRLQKDQNIYYVLQIAPGPRFSDVMEDWVRRMCLDMGRAMTDRETGHIFQTMLLSAASFTEEDASDTEAETVDGETTTTKDPFAPPPEGEAVEEGEASF